MNGKKTSESKAPEKIEASSLYGEMRRPKEYDNGGKEYHAGNLAEKIAFWDLLTRATAWYFGHAGVGGRSHGFSKAKKMYRIQCEFIERGEYSEYETTYRGWANTWHQALVNCYVSFLTDRSRIAFSTEEALG